VSDSTVDFYLDLGTLDTGNNKRDKDMRETLETGQYPFAEFFGKFVSAFDASSRESQLVTVQGEFKIHDVSKNITMEGILQRTGEGLNVEAEWVLDLTDYDIEPPGILFYRVDEEIEIKINALLKPLEE
jgi:polyisoprenoid-binding protein YceI